MKIDPAAMLGAVIREVANREQEGRPARAVIATRNYDTTMDDLWDALTSAERIPRWFLPVTGELRPGGRYQLEGNAGGEIRRCEPPRLLSVTWEFGGGVSWLTVTLRHDGVGGTRLELEHLALVDDHWDRFGPGAVGVGWDLALMGLALHLASGTAAVDRAGFMAWSASEDGKAFVRASSEAWGTAGIAAGTAEAAARAAASRTTAFYTGEPEGGGSKMHAFDILGDPVRRRILELLATGELSSGEIVAVIEREHGITQSAVSQQLRVLRDAGFASARAEGARRIYAVEPARLREVDDWLGRFRAFWLPKLDALATEVARGKRKRRQSK